jgi:hypothetical protein
MKVFSQIIVYITVVMLMVSCRQEYPLPEEARNLNLLVVEGVLNSGTGRTIIKLTRTVNPRDSATIKPELRAQVTIEGDNNTSFSLTGNTSGEYIHNQLNLNVNQKYRLRIKTFNGKEYLSDYVPVLQAPLIDSIHWQRSSDEGVQILASTHDPLNKTRYYRWEYEETWELNSAYPTYFEYRNGSVVDRLNAYEIYYCWNSATSNNIVVGSSAKLSQDVISAQPIRHILPGSELIGIRYSILVRQYALTKDAYNFWEVMKKNTEQVGTLFDPQPSQLPTNIHCLSDPDEPVIGFVSAGSYTEKRLFINRAQVYPWSFFLQCELRVIPLHPDSIKINFSDFSLIPVTEFFDRFGFLAGYNSSTRICVDCRARGGDTIRPLFW